MKYLLDTDHLSGLQKSTGRDYECLSARMAQIPIADFGISIVTIHEQFLGSHTYRTYLRSLELWAIADFDKLNRHSLVINN